MKVRIKLPQAVRQEEGRTRTREQQRLDLLLTERGLAGSRHKAQA
jgi:hypothetical protein